jgi:hypothetical protein
MNQRQIKLMRTKEEETIRLTKSNTIGIAVAHLKTAHHLLGGVKALKARNYVNRAIKSAQGAERNALRFEFKEENK